MKNPNHIIFPKDGGPPNSAPLDSYGDITKQEIKEMKHMSAKKSLQLGTLLDDAK